MMRIGIDFDNTIAGYDDAFVSLAREWGLDSGNDARTKNELRAALRNMTDGEARWQKLQGRIYGAEIGRAVLIDGVDGFLVAARDRGAAVFIVSHKTQFGHQDPDQVNLRQAATEWMNRRCFFEPDGYAIPPANLFFENTREDKINRIASLGLDWFIDDLAEVLADPAFPGMTGKILLSPEPAKAAPALRVAASWQEIAGLIFP